MFAVDGTPRALELISPKVGERESALTLLARIPPITPITVIGDKGYAGAEFEASAQDLGFTIVRLRRKGEEGRAPHLAAIRQRTESIFWTCKDILTLERHGARPLPGLSEAVLARFCCLAACVMLNHQLNRPSRALGDYIA